MAAEDQKVILEPELDSSRMVHELVEALNGIGTYRVVVKAKRLALLRKPESRRGDG